MPDEPMYDTRLPDIELIRHPTAEALFRQFWAPTLADDPEGTPLEECDFGGEDFDGNHHPATFADCVAGLEAQGLWGFADPSKRAVHFWCRPDVDPLYTVMVLAHEIGHLTGKPYKTPRLEEIRAQRFGQVAALALKWAAELDLKGLCVVSGYGRENMAGLENAPMLEPLRFRVIRCVFRPEFVGKIGVMVGDNRGERHYEIELEIEGQRVWFHDHELIQERPNA